MLLPQTDAFHTLVDRLKCLPSCGCGSGNEEVPRDASGLDESVLLRIFAQNRASQTENEKPNGVLEHEVVPTEEGFSFRRELSLRHYDVGRP